MFFIYGTQITSDYTAACLMQMHKRTEKARATYNYSIHYSSDYTE